jgi:hypothetical protein
MGNSQSKSPLTLGGFAMDSFPTLLTETQAARFLTMSVKTLQAWRSRGQPPNFCKIGRSVRYEKRALEAFIEEHQRRSTSDQGHG